MDAIVMTKEQIAAVGVAIQKVEELTRAMARCAEANDVKTFDELYRQREDAIFNIRVVMIEQDLPLPPIKCEVKLPF